MKAIILSLSALFVMGTTNAFADDATGPAVVKSFQREFRGAENVKWDQEGGYEKATFVLGGHRTIAWFESTGELIGSIRDLLYNQLPMVVMGAVDKKFKDAIIYDVREVSNSEGTRYKLTLEQHGKKYDVSVLPGGIVDSVKKIK